MMYTRERLMKAVRDAGGDGQPFTLGEVRAQLGLKSRDKRELKRFRSRFRECSQILGDSLEKLGPNTYRLKTTAGAPAAAARPAAQLAPRDQAAAGARLIERVGAEPRRPRERTAPDTAHGHGHGGALPAPQPAAAAQTSLGDRLSSWFGRVRMPAMSVRPSRDKHTAATALSRLAVDLQPKAANFEYRWIDGKLQVTLAEHSRADK